MNAIAQPLDALMGALGSLGDPTRLRLLRLLERRELGVADLVSALQLPQSTVSRHLKVLSDQGWVKNRAEGTNRIYRMPNPEDTVAKKLWHVAKDQTEEWATAKQDQLRLDQLEVAPPPGGSRFLRGRRRHMGPSALGAIRQLFQRLCAAEPHPLELDGGRSRLRFRDSHRSHRPPRGPGHRHRSVDGHAQGREEAHVGL
jgi:DNA-binding transcriptional ArsR family regulator